MHRGALWADSDVNLEDAGISEKIGVNRELQNIQKLVFVPCWWFEMKRRYHTINFNRQWSATCEVSYHL
jgi:hypothetical protein